MLSSHEHCPIEVKAASNGGFIHKDVISMLSIKIANVVPLSNMQLLVFFENGVIKKFDVKPIIKDYPEFEALKEPALFQMVKVEPGGYGVSWNEDLDCSEGELWENGVEVPISAQSFS